MNTSKPEESLADELKKNRRLIAILTKSLIRYLQKNGNSIS